MFCFVLFSTCFLSFTFLNQGPASKIDAAGSACRGRCLHQALQSCVLTVRFWYSGLELQLGPLSHSFEETLRETRFSFEVSSAAFCGMGAFSGSSVLLPLSQLLLVQALWMFVPRPRNWALSESLGWGLSWVEDVGAQPEGQ